MSELLKAVPSGDVAAYPAPTRALHDPPPVPRHGVLVVLAWELEKLTAQLPTRLAFLVCLLGPFAFVLAVKLTHTVPADTLFGRWVDDSGFATPLVVLGFAASWGFPLLTCIVAGDIFSAEDHLGTWKTLLTRSRGRGSFFLGKTLAVGAFIVAMLVVLAGSSLAAGVLVIGHQPLIGLSGNVITAGSAAGLVVGAWATVVLPCLAFGGLGILFSVATRNSLVGVIAPVAIGLLMQFGTLIDGIDPIRRSLLGNEFFAWHGLFASPSFSRPIVENLVVSAAYLVICLVAAWTLLRRRDISGG
jgi:ABC-2 type transport system permease protein